MKKFILLGSSAFVTLMNAAPTVAQTAAQATGVLASDEPASGIADIIVTAQRRTENQQHAAIAIDVVAPQQLRNAGVVTPATLNAAVPSLAVQQAGGANTTFFIRGIGNFTNNAYSDPAIAFNLDGVYVGRPTSTTGTFFDLERIEVLKGPQGTLYGRNATGGAINVIPARPRIGENTANFIAGYGNYNAFDAEAVANLAIGDKAAFRIAGKIVDRSGFNEDGTSDEKGQAVRAQILVKPTSNLSMRISGDYSHQGGYGVGSSFISTARYTPGSAPTATSPANYAFTPTGFNPYGGLLSAQSRAFFAGLVIDGPNIHPAPFSTPRLNNKYWGVTSEVTLDTGIGSLTVLPAYRDAKLDDHFNGGATRDNAVKEHDTQFSLEARLQGKTIGMFDWLLGGFYFDEKVAARYAINLYQIASFQDFNSNTKSYAAFGRVTANLTDRLRLVAGARYTKDKKSFRGDSQTLVEICAASSCIGGPSLPVIDTLSQFPNGPTQAFTPVPYGNSGNLVLFIPNSVRAGINKGRVTYRLGAEFDVGSASLLYASYETGYRSGGFSNAPGYETFAPEYVDAYTLGSKNRFFDNKLQLNLEAFYWKYRDQQVSHFGFDSNNNVNFFTENVGKSRSMGVEVEAQALVAAHTRINGSILYLDSHVDKFTYVIPQTGAEPVTGCKVTSVSPNYSINCAGRPGYNSPRWSINLGVEQTLLLGMHKIILSGEGRYRSNSVVGFDYLPDQNTGNNVTFDTSVSFGSQDDIWSVTAFVHNITDKAVKTYVQYSGGSGSVTVGNFTPPRTYGLRASYAFR